MPLYLMTPLKTWRFQEQDVNGVSDNAIDRWRASGRYGHLVFHTCRRAVFVSGTTLPMARKVTGRHFYYDWSKADWTKRNREIARAVGAPQNGVAWARARFAPATVRKKK